MIQDRIKQYIDFKGVTPYKFCKNLGFSMGYLDKKGAIGTDKYLKIIEYYSDINPVWLLTGKGSMLKENNVKIDLTENEREYLQLLKENLKEKSQQLDACKKEVESLKKYKIST